MDVGAPQREIYVEPLVLPEPLRTEPAPERPQEAPAPQEEPVTP